MKVVNIFLPSTRAIAGWGTTGS